MLATLNDTLRHSQAGRYAVPAFDCVEDLMVRTILETCEALRCPAILMGHRVALCRGLMEAVQTQTRPDPLPRDLFGPIRQRPAEKVTEKIRLLFAENWVCKT